MRILNLILYSDTPFYQNMKGLLSLYLATVPDLTHYYYCFDPLLTTPFVVQGNVIKFKGVESFRPGILDKTLRVLKLTFGWGFDYVVRSNISTVVNFHKLKVVLGQSPFQWGGWVRESPRRDATKGITAKNPLLYISGTCIILSRYAVAQILQSQHLIDKSLIDDIALAFLARRLGVALIHIGRVVKNGKYQPNKIIYRNKVSDRNLDVERMKWQVTELLVANRIKK